MPSSDSNNLKPFKIAVLEVLRNKQLSEIETN